MFINLAAWLAVLCSLQSVESLPPNTREFTYFNDPLRSADLDPADNAGAAGKCGYASCHPTKPNMLNVHIVAHTHDDVGWLKTVDQYYYGGKPLIQKAGVQYIIDSVVAALLQDPEKRFIYVESAFFFKWWREQTAEMQNDVKMLVNEGRLEFIGGAWSMNDEATTHYQSIIDQFAWGLRRLNDTFGQCGRPRVGWQIDPFGHSREMASIFAQMGYDGLFFGRLDYQDKNNRLMQNYAEMIWHGSANLGKSSDLFTGALYNNYQAPPGFCFDILCADEPINDGKHSPDNNVKSRVDTFLAYVQEQSQYYSTNNVIVTMGGDFTYQAADIYYKNLDKLIRPAHSYVVVVRYAYSTYFRLAYTQIDAFFEFINKMAQGYRSPNLLITMGEDFHYQNANMWYKNLDKLIKYANERQTNGSNINLIYSTPSCYLKALHDAGNTWPTKSDDFFPYASDPHAYWTGYFTSRPTLKRYEREGNHFLQVCKQLSVQALPRSPEYDAHLTFMRETMGIMQHHDAVTGTEKQAVAQDYAKRMSVALRACGANIKTALNRLANSQGKKDKLEFKSCSLLNISSCAMSEQTSRFMLTLYNPLPHSTDEYVRIPVPDYNYVIMDHNGGIASQLVPVPLPVQSIPHRASSATYELVFKATQLPSVGYRNYYIEHTPSRSNHIAPTAEPKRSSSQTTIGNDRLRLTFDTNGFLTAVKADGESHTVSQEFLYYEAAVGNNMIFANRSSGAYIFRPVRHFTATNHVKLTVYKGRLVEEVHQQFNDWISQVVRVYRDQNHAEFEWLVGPIPTEDGTGKEVISRFQTDIESKGIFYTDSNGREMLRRERNQRPTWKLKLEEYEAGNYYPVTAKIALEDDNTRMAILTDRAQGGSSLTDGDLELMVHRRLLKDDAFGVEEALNETEHGLGLIARGKHYLFIGQSCKRMPESLKTSERLAQLETLLPSAKLFSNMDAYTPDQWRNTFKNQHTGLLSALPKSVHLLTLEPWHENELLVRFEHILEQEDDKNMPEYVQFNISQVLGNFNIRDIRETTLDGNAWLDETQRMEFVPMSEEMQNNQIDFPQPRTTPQMVQLQRADKPLLAAKYTEEEVPLATQAAAGNRLLRDINPQVYRLNQPKVPRRIMNSEDNKFIIELSPMQIRTYVVYLSKSDM